MKAFFIRATALEITTADKQKKTITGLRIQFRVEKSSKSEPNKCDIRIYNLNDNSKGILKQKGAVVRLSVGYRGESAKNEASLETIYIGDVIKVVHERAGSDIVTSIECGDGDNKYRNARIDKGYPPGISAQSLFDDLKTELGLPVSSVAKMPDYQFSKGIAFTGLVRDRLDQLTSKFGMEWSIQDHTLHVLEVTKPTKEGTIVLDKDSGLIGYPSITKEGIEFQSLMNPSIRIGRQIKIDSSVVKGVFKVAKVIHEGDNSEGEFLTKCEAKRR